MTGREMNGTPRGLHRRKVLSPAKEIAFTALTCAMLIGVQYALYALPGVECVTVLLACTAYVFGARFGFFTGLCFALLRCIVFGFYIQVVILYCIYFPLFGLVFGLAGRLKGTKKLPLSFKVSLNAVCAALCVAALCIAGTGALKIAPVYEGMVYTLLYIAGVFFGIAALTFDCIWIFCRGGEHADRAMKLIFVTSAAALCTICFTLLDDALAPLILGLSERGALAYFYASFAAMLPQTVCTIVTVALLFVPITQTLDKILR